MTALPTSALAPAPAPEAIDFNRWISAADAASILQLHPDSLTRKCREQLEAFGLARKVSQIGGGEKWYIARRWNLALAPGEAGAAHRVPRLDRFPAAQVERAWDRAAVVMAYRDARSTTPGKITQWEPMFVERMRAQYPRLKVSVASVRRWYNAYQYPADIVKLIDQRGGNTRGGADPAAWDHFKALYLTEQKRTVKQCWRMTRDYARAERLTWTSYDQVRRQLDTMIPPEIQAQYREPREYRSRHRPFIPQDPDAFFPGERWDGDHCQLDMTCRLGAQACRPWITAWMDWRTRRIVGWLLSPSPNSATILAAFRSAILDPVNHGGPNLVWIDNGKDYDSYTFHGRTKVDRHKVRITDQVRVKESAAAGIFGMLDIEAHFAIPFNPNGKGRLERWFGTLHDQFDREWPTYCGKDSASRPENHAQMVKRQLPAFDSVRTALAEFIAAYNASADHSREDMAGHSPDSLMAQCPRIRKLEHPKALDEILRMWAQPCTVGRNGVTIRPAGAPLTYGAADPALRPFKGRGRIVHVSYDPNDLSRVRVYDDKLQFIAEVMQNAYGGGKAGLDHARELMRQRRRYERAKRDVQQGMFKFEVLRPDEQLAQVAHELKQKAKAPPVKLVTPVESPFEQASKADQKLPEYEPAEPLDLLGGWVSPGPRVPIEDDKPIDLLSELGAMRRIGGAA